MPNFYWVVFKKLKLPPLMRNDKKWIISKRTEINEEMNLSNIN